MLSIERLKSFYEEIGPRVRSARERMGRPLTLVEKILAAHAVDPSGITLERWKSYLSLRPDWVAMQDATAQMAILQFMLAGLDTVALPVTVHCDHLVQARAGAAEDLRSALSAHGEVYDFLRSAAGRYGMAFWPPGTGIIHQVVLEHYAWPGGMLLGTDSHTPNAGGLGMLAIGVGGADAAEVMAGLSWELKCPKLVGVRLTGKLRGWASPKDVILRLCSILTAKGGTNKIIEYFGSGCASISATGKATIANMGAELGATTSIFPFDDQMAVYLCATGREAVADLAVAHREELAADAEVAEDPESYYDEIVEIDLSALEAQVAGPHTPDLVRAVSQMPAAVSKEGYPERLSAALVGSCTNSSYEDIGRAALVASEAARAGLKVRSPFFITPGSSQIYETVKRDGQLAALEAIGGTVLANACGPCIGQWKREDIKPGQTNAIITSFNRNFPRRNDGNAQTLAFIASPEIVTAYALAGTLRFDPSNDPIEVGEGKAVRLKAPAAPALPEKGFALGAGCKEPLPVEQRRAVRVVISPASERLQKLEPFAPWDGKDFTDLLLLVKVRGKCTTDHISPAGPWLRYRGHLDRISDNIFLGANSAFGDRAGEGKNWLKGGEVAKLAAIARHYKEKGVGWVVVGDENYGEGSSREHAAMSPRHLGCKAVIARSFARIHETNLKKQGILPLYFDDPADYERVREDDRVSVIGLDRLAPGQTLEVELKHSDGSKERFVVRHSLNAQQIEWFRAGSALNAVRQASKVAT